ncbi:MCE family protein [Nocardioides sp. Root140]|uniref:MCE family protein n=1 Tax=Nocardioides sp. Root140 TaxID=1736460 RepID=UPI0006F78053|nr:MCE family protein [Nocardioides sp. Root140]KQY56419.1 hypothetical protein ASD30_08720 [Nocardioides sp. Root140]KRF13848.1 hypothetical protein ASG90_13580 [Nocardioides sp. Soil797]
MSTRRIIAPRGRWISALLAVVALLTTGCEIQPNDNTLPGQVAVGDDGYSVEVHFDQIANLVPNATVMKDNVVIGTVAGIDVDGWEAVVELRLLKDIELPSTAEFSVGQKTLLGAQYVEVSVPGGDKARATKHSEPLGDGEVIGVEQTGSYPATEQVLGAVALLLNNGGLSQISTITDELSTALHGRVPDTRSLIRRSNELLTVLDQNRGEIVRALDSLNDFSAGLREDQTTVATAIDKITPGLKTLEQERDRLVRAVTATGRTGDRAVKVVRASETALTANLKSLGPILSNLGKASESLPEALKIGLTIPFPAMTTRDAVRGDYANLFATLDLRVGSLADSWLGGIPPALQAGDPLRNPLAPPTKKGGPTDGVPDSDGGTDDGTTEDEPDPGDTPTPDIPEEPSPGCLLSFLGLC